MSITFMDLIHFDEDVMDFRESLFAEQLPLYVYGAGSYAKSVLQLLNGMAKKVEFCVVDDPYYKEGTLVEGLPVISVSNFLRDVQQDVCVVMGMTNFMAGSELQKQSTYIKSVYYPTGLSFENGKKLSKEYLWNNREMFQRVYEMLSDEHSKKCFCVWTDALIHNDVTKIFPACEGIQTYFSNSLFTVNKGSTLIDVGAYTGDSIEEFIAATDGVFEKIWAIEGDGDLCEQIKMYVKKRNITNKVEIINSCVWDEEGTLFFDYLENEVNSVGLTIAEEMKEGKSVQVVTLDSLFGQEECCNFDVIKVNMRNSEKIIKGATTLIKKAHPIIAAKVGYDRSLFYSLIQEIMNIDETYQFYFRFNNAKVEELVLYAL